MEFWPFKENLEIHDGNINFKTHFYEIWINGEKVASMMNPDAKEYSKVNVSIANDINDPTPGFYRNFSFKRDNSSLGPTQNFSVHRRNFCGGFS